MIAAQIVGRRIKEVRYLDAAETDALMWSDAPRGVAIVLDDDTVLIASSDAERNAAGTFLVVGETGLQVLV